MNGDVVGVGVHCPKHSFNLRINTEPVTVGAHCPKHSFNLRINTEPVTVGAHCPKHIFNLRINTEPATVEADATVYVGLFTVPSTPLRKFRLFFLLCGLEFLNFSRLFFPISISFKLPSTVLR